MNKNTILISNDKKTNVAETLYLYSIPGLVDSIIKSSIEPKETRTKYIEDEEW